jgi:FtsH-binding integral membrane protein
MKERSLKYHPAATLFVLSVFPQVALTIYAVRTKADFTGCGAYILVLFLGLIMLIMVYSFVRGPART